MATARTWTIKGVSDRTRDAVYEATRAEGLTVGEWVDRALARAAEEARHPRPPAASREEVAEVVRELLDERLAPLVEGSGEPPRPRRGTAPRRRRRYEPGYGRGARCSWSRRPA